MNTVHVRKRTLIVVLGLIAVVVGGSVWSALRFTSSSTGPATSESSDSATATNTDSKTFYVSGTLKVNGSCSGPGYNDLGDGTTVELRDKKDEVVAATTLRSDGYCAYSFMLRDVPAGHGLYGLKIGDGHRGVQWATEDEARNGGFFDLTVGGK